MAIILNLYRIAYNLCYAIFMSTKFDSLGWDGQNFLPRWHKVTWLFRETEPGSPKRRLVILISSRACWVPVIANLFAAFNVLEYCKSETRDIETTLKASHRNTCLYARQRVRPIPDHQIKEREASVVKNQPIVIYVVSYFIKVSPAWWLHYLLVF